MSDNPELLRLKTTYRNTGWKKFGPYLSERQWGTVREDYSRNGDAWNHITHDMARSKAYRWGEDGIGGFSDNKQTVCFALAFWNGQDHILKERLFGLGNSEGNHGEDVKEYYYYLDNTPTHSYMKMLYKYPQDGFPYEKLVRENKKRTRQQPEYELMHTGVFDDNRYFDIFIEYAKADPDDMLIKITAHNRGASEALLHIIPTLWFRNTWTWGYDSYRPSLMCNRKSNEIDIQYRNFSNYKLTYEGAPELLFCENETNRMRLYGQPNVHKYCKDGFNNYVIRGDTSQVNPDLNGTKAGLNYKMRVSPHGTVSIRLRLDNKEYPSSFKDFEEVFQQRIQEANIFYKELQKNVIDQDLVNLQRHAYAGMLWSKQHYNYDVKKWLEGDPATKQPPEERKSGRNSKWRHVVNSNVISMPDKWEYPWYAAWDLAFHCIPLARLDPEFAKRQLELMLREYYMHPNGQIPAYEWNFGDVNPPVHAWAAWKVYWIDKSMNGKADTDFLEKIFHKLLLNFTWWVNRKDAAGNSLFEGGFLGLDNIGVFDRSQSLPTGGYLEQADGTAWMAMYCLNMLRIALEVSQIRPYYQEMASKFFEHFLTIASAMFNIGKENADLWDEEDAFYYDVLHPLNKPAHLLKVRSIVGIIPLFAVEVLHPALLEKLPDFTRRLEWVLKNRPEQANLISRWYEHGKGETRMLSLVRIHRLKCILHRMLDENEFLSDYGIRSLSKFHQQHPYHYHLNGTTYSVAYLPGESDSSLFGGNSNWRGPIWFPINYMIITSLERFHQYYGDNLKVEFPTGSGKEYTLDIIAREINRRLVKIFKRDKKEERPVYGKVTKFQHDPHFRDHMLFYEYFHGDHGCGLGASHQTGWTGLFTEMVEGCDW